MPPPPVSQARFPLVNIDHGVTEIGIERVGGFGPVPQFTFIVDNRGNVRFDGSRSVEPIGEHPGRMSEIAFLRLANYVADCEIDKLERHYGESFDLGVTYTMIKRNGKTTIIKASGSLAPMRLVALWTLLEEERRAVKWIQGEETKTARE
jgi:hypothetical protein